MKRGFYCFFSGLNCVLLCLTRFYWVLLGLKGLGYWISLDFVGFDMVLLGFTRFY